MEEIAAELEMITLAADAPRSLVVKPRDHPTDLNQDEIGKRRYVLIGDGQPLLYAVDYDGVWRCADSEIPERARVTLPVGVLNLVFEDAEDIKLVGIAHSVRTGLSELVESFRNVASIVVEDGIQNRITLLHIGNKRIEPALLLHDVVGKNGVIDRI